MKEREIKNSANYAEKIETGNVVITEPVSEKPSMTVPDMVLSMKEMIKAYIRGEPVMGKVPVYNGEIDFPDFERMDELEKIDVLREIDKSFKEDVERVKEEAQKSREEKEAKKMAEAKEQNFHDAMETLAKQGKKPKVED